MKSNKKKSKTKKNVVKSEKVESETQSFDAWFYYQVRAGKLRPVQKLEIITFFKEKGLTDIEDPEKYNEIIKYY